MKCKYIKCKWSNTIICKKCLDPKVKMCRNISCLWFQSKRCKGRSEKLGDFCFERSYFDRIENPDGSISFMDKPPRESIKTEYVH